MNLFELVAVLTLDRSGYDRGLDDAEDKANSFGSKLKSGLGTAAKVGAAAIGAASTAVVAFGKSSVDAGMTFDSSMAQVAATMGTTVDKIQNLRDFAQEMGSKTAFSASQAADALNYMALAGYDAETSMTMLPNVLNLAAAGGIDLAYASDMITDSQSALGLSLDETAELVDKMAKASSKSNTSVAQLGEAILTVGGTAKTLAGGTTELSTALGILADNGVKGAEGGTALRNIILSLSAPTDTAAKAIQSLGIEVFDAAGNMRPLNETFSDLDKALSTMMQGEQTQVLNSIFNKVDLKSVNALLANTNERFDELSGYIDDAAGAASAMADTQLDTLSGDITIFQSALEGARITLSDQLTPTLRQFVQFGTDGIGKMTDAFKEGGLSGAMDALGGVLADGIAVISDLLPTVADAGMGLIDAFVGGILDNLPALTQAAFDIVLKLIDGIGKTLPKLVTAALNIVKTLANGISKNIKTITKTIVDVVLEIAKTLTAPDTLLELLDAGLQIVLGLVDGIVEAIPEITKVLPLIIQNIVDFLIGATPMIIYAGIQLLTALVDSVDEIIDGIVTAIPIIIDGIVNALFKDNNLNKIIEGGVRLFVALVQSTSKIISGIAKALPEIIKGVTDALFERETIQMMIDAGVDLFVALVDNIPEILEGLASAAWDIVTGLAESIVGMAGEMANAGVELWNSLWSGFTGNEPESAGTVVSLGNAVSTSRSVGGMSVMERAESAVEAAKRAPVKRNKITMTGEEGYRANLENSMYSRQAQPLTVILQMPNGVEAGRQYIEDINMAKRVDGEDY